MKSETKTILAIGYYHHGKTIILTGENMGYQIPIPEQLLEFLITRKDMITTYSDIENAIAGMNMKYASVVIHGLRKQYDIERVRGEGIIYHGRKQEKI